MNVRNSAQNAAVEIAAFSVSKALGAGVKGGLAGLVVQPVVWAATGSGPDAGDAFIYGTGAVGVFAGAIVAVPAIVTGVVKAAVDDHTASLLAVARGEEPAAYREGIDSIDNFNFWASSNHNYAMHIAGKGGVVWRHRNGVYCYIRDGKGRLICDYEPTSWVEIFHPVLPLKPVGDGVRFSWRRR